MIIDTLRRGAAAAVTLGIAVAALVWAPAAAAAPPYETEAALHSVQFVEESTGTGWQAQLEGRWSLPDDAATPAGFVVDLPEGLRGLTDAFDLLDPDGAAMGSCTVTATQIVCDLDADYLAAHPRNVGGTFFFWVQVTTEVTETTEVTYDFAGVSATVTVAGPAQPCPDCTFEGKGNGKWGWYNRDTDSILWGVEIAAPREGSGGGETVTVLERLGDRQDWVRTAAGAPDLHVVGTDQVGADGYPTNWTTVDDRVGMTLVETAAGVQVTFTTEAGWFYAVHGWTTVTDGGDAGTYTNEADVTIADAEVQTVRAQVVRRGGGGTGSGDGVGRFAITKRVDGASAAVTGLTYTGTYVVTAPGGAEITGTFAVDADATWTSPQFEAGSVVVLEETAPTGPAGVDWSAPVFSASELTVVGGETTAVTLTNRVALARGSFTASKVLIGTGTSMVDADAVFVLAYSYPAGAGYAAGSGTLELPADGAVVTSPELPVGAVVTVSEAAPATVDGATWTGAAVSASEVQIVRSGMPHVTVTNTITAAPTPDPSPSVGVMTDHVDPTPDVLAHTGGALPVTMLLLGGLAVLVGAALRVRRGVTRS